MRNPYNAGSTTRIITQNALKQHSGSRAVMSRLKSYSGKSIVASSQSEEEEPNDGT